MILEIIVTNKKEAIIAQKAGADRLELVRSLDKGGLTPTLKTIKEVTSAVKIPVNVMVRPHDKSFVYSENDFKKIIKSIEEIKKTKANAIVFGSLTSKNIIDEHQLKEVIKAKGKLDIVFHRAFDQTKNFKKNLDILIKNKVDGLLSSGLKKNAELGLTNLTNMIKYSKNKITIMPGSGIKYENAYKIKEVSKAKEIHVGTAVRNGYKYNGALVPEQITLIKLLLDSKKI